MRYSLYGNGREHGNYIMFRVYPGSTNLHNEMLSLLCQGVFTVRAAGSLMNKGEGILSQDDGAPCVTGRRCARNLLLKRRSVPFGD